jgi:asparagine synthase (glutamine-hydrolysing)
MFAVAVWDCGARSLSLVRDRLGIKLVFWGSDGRLIFTSELKALRCVPGFVGEIGREALAAYLRYSYVPRRAASFAGFRT